MKKLFGVKVLAAAAVCLAGVFLAAADGGEAVWQEDFANFAKWKVSGPETLTAELDKEFSPGDTCLKYTFKVDNPAEGFSWPQQIRGIPGGVPLDDRNCYMEFDAFYKPVKGSMTLILSLKEIANLQGVGFRLTPNEWKHVKVRLEGKKPGVKLVGYAFVIPRRSTKPDSEAVFYIKNLRIVRGEKF